MHWDTLFASRGLELHASTDGGESFTPVAAFAGSGLRRFASRFRMLARAGRLGFHALQLLPNGDMLGVIRRHVVYREQGGDRFHPVFRFPRGSRPLSLCVDPRHGVFFGEYFNNRDRDEVHVFGSAEGQEWRSVHVFPSGSIRHVHGVVHDPFRDGIWVLTGDEDNECGLWFTGDGFRSLEKIVGGDQRTRAVSVIPVEDGLIVPTDSPRIRNCIQLLDLGRIQFESLSPLPGSAFHAVRSGDLYLVSTAGEPSALNDSFRATMWASMDGCRWHCICEYPADWWYRALPFARPALQYPELQLVPGTDETPYVFAYGRSVQGADDRLLRWSRSRIRTRLRSLADTDRDTGE